MTQPNNYEPLENNNNENKPIEPEKEKKKLNISFSFNVVYRVFRSLLFLGVLIAAAIGFLGLGVGIGYFASLVSDVEVPGKEELSQKINDVEQQSKILYSNDDLVSVIKSDLIRTSVKSDNISPLVKKALVSTEDENFYDHKGIVPKAIARATLSDVTGLGGSSGGSTITQQLIKQQVLTSETSYKRKASEIVLAARTEKFFSKEEILNAYLNVSPFGRNNQGENIAGIEEAALGIFNVHAKDVSLPQAAFLAGLPQSPIEYSPYTNTGEFKKDFKLGLNRKNDVLFNMYREKMINEKEYEEAKKYDLTKDFKQPEPPKSDDSGFLYNYLYDEAARVTMPIYYERDGLTDKDIAESNELEKKYQEIAKRELRQNGYTIKSSIDKDIHNAMQEATQQYGYILDDGRDKLLETGGVLMDNKTGRIYGFIGGRNYAQSQYNHAFTMRRSPGSTIKPLIAYAPAIDTGLIGSESKLSDFPKKYSDGTVINNYSDKGSSTFKSAREALKWSLNIPVVNLYGELGKQTNVKEYFDKMNIGLDNDEYSFESIPLGGTHNGMTVNEGTAAYATLANKGVYNEGFAIEKITDNNGKVIYEHEAHPVEVFKPSTASIMNDMMRDVLKSGTGQPAKDALYSQSATLANADWVGKTGTSELQKDYWFIASTPSVTMSNWIGYDDNTLMYDTWNKQNMIFWANVTNYVYQRNPDIFGVNEKFSLDSGVNKQKVVEFTGEKESSFNTEGYSMNLRGSKTETSLYSAGNNAPDSSFRFGIGGTDDNYKSAWNSYIRPANKTPQKYNKRR
ncbi:transglycosylase domain-containing protein [Vagococcus carniphilus]|uniref:Uncharacterized protein n=1 Tax=Vagococcus carniphilus TaxID=218144 RepID=A0A430AYQ7_9ENTE|nr:transglycosylase domain-containing protein [Vagococcus carniphilus]QNN72086.1 penicillin-binding protein [Vagococcus carniphilus]RSU13179.1 hypothetical protein CBF28_09960 [Vagococcus carniphilus]